jgi:hexosaminidase
MAYPRALALAEVLWTPKDKRDWRYFVGRLHQHTDRLDGMQVNYAKHLYDPIASFTSTPNGLKVVWNTNLSGQDIFYANDSLSTHWNRVEENDTVTFNTAGSIFYKTKSSRIYSLHYFPTKSQQAVVSVDQLPDDRYPGRQSVMTLTDGMKGTTHFNGSDWCAWQGVPFNLRLTFNQGVSVDSITIGILIAEGSWIYGPEELVITGKTADHGVVSIASLRSGELKNGRNELTFTANGLIFNEILLHFKPDTSIPDGKPGAGSPAWTFIDEIEVY